ncbi:NAD(P)/FAD-dependent oxidoreductase [Nocardioides sp. CER19]|uniref:NAD(P)/FAD-dependent oxidoreductase n=1 Tax=Nocardioides sp. CER19 TaxID=3038538 RepID=UPI002447C4CF|nr:NAD(P)/FAD-dependent oxidoreductase [Nocardioides sp. CER19]MDH2416929.1 NAD(P)/FAD-dependent oxidoreductase [Nocardioides sp. CER19]
MADRVVVGSSVAALVAAERLAARGNSVRLLVPPGPVGGGFASLRQDGRVLELGVRLLELDYEGVGAPPPLVDYVPGVIGHRPYVRLIADYVADLVGDRLVEADRPRMLVDRSIVDDLYFTTDATALRDALDTGTRAAIAAEAAACAAEHGPAGVLGEDLTDDMSLLEASLRNHGKTFHRLLMQPVADKLVEGGTAAVPASLRRKIWLPLFWPRTLAEAAGAAEVGFQPRRPFHTVRDGGAGEVVTALVARLEAVGIATERVGRLETARPAAHGRTFLAFDDGAVVETDRPVVGVAAEQLFAAVGADYRPERARTVVCWLEVATDELVEVPSLLNVVDADIPVLRVSTGGSAPAGRTVLTVELRHDTPEDDIASTALRGLGSLGLVRPGAQVDVLRGAAVRSFALPTARNAADFEAAAAVLAQQGLACDVIGAATGFGADALGEQIIQGLRTAEASDA